MTKTLRGSAESYLVKSVPPLVDVTKLNLLLEHARNEAKLSGLNMIVVGPKGVSKSLTIRHFAHKNKIPLITSDCSEDSRRATEIGSFVLNSSDKGTETPFLLGTIPTAIEIANETGEAILLFEEINTLTPQIQKLLNPLTDFRKSYNIPEVEKVVELKPDAKLWVFGTMNEGYLGTYPLNEDIKSRFRMLRIGYPTTNEEKQIILSNVSKINETIMGKVIQLASETRKSEDFGYSLSPRDTVAICQDIASFGVPVALRLMAGKFPSDQTENLSQRIKAIFGSEG